MILLFSKKICLKKFRNGNAWRQASRRNEKLFDKSALFILSFFMRKLFLLQLFLAAFAVSLFGQTTLPYKDPRLSIDERIKDLLSRMTPEEKFWQMFMIPGDLDHADSLQYKNGIFGFQVSATGQGDAAGQMLHYSTTESGL